MVVKGWTMHNGKRRYWTSTSNVYSPHLLDFERNRIGKEVHDWMPHITEVWVETRIVTDWSKTDL
jgi:hypothetical protein